jgi:glutamate-1-semialdehyde 2,1-aminomutase
MDGITNALIQAGHVHRIVGHPTLFDVVFTDREVKNYRDVRKSDSKKYAALDKSLRESRILKNPGKFYPSLALTDRDVEVTIASFVKAAKEIG